MRKEATIFKPSSLLIVACLMLTASSSIAQKEAVLYNFQGIYGNPPGDGSDPYGLISGGNGKFYGYTLIGGILGECYYGILGCGTVFEFSIQDGKPTETVLHDFQGGVDGWQPSSLVVDQSGNLYGTTILGGNYDDYNCSAGCGTIYQLTPPKKDGDPWTKTTLYLYPGHGLLSNPVGLGLVDGWLYGATENGGIGHGTIFRLQPGSGKDPETLYTFQGGTDGETPRGDLLLYKGAFYGLTAYGGNSPLDCDGGCGTVFRLVPPSSQSSEWQKTTLFEFQGSPIDAYAPIGGLLVDAQGDFYGASYFGGNVPNAEGTGTVFELIPPLEQDGAWTEDVLHYFTGPSDGAYVEGIVMDASGNIYGTTNFGGSSFESHGMVFELAPDNGTWTETILHSFLAETNGESPSALPVYQSGNLVGITSEGGTGPCSGGCGVIFGVKP